MLKKIDARLFIFLFHYRWSIKLNYLVKAVILHVAFALAGCVILPQFVERNCGQHHWRSSKRNRERAKAGVRKEKCQRW